MIINANGIPTVEDTDIVAPLEGLMNLSFDAVSDSIGGLGTYKRQPITFTVANSTEKSALAGLTTLIAGDMADQVDNGILYRWTGSAWVPRSWSNLTCVLTLTAGSIPNTTQVVIGAAAPLWVEDYDPNGWHSTSGSTNRITPLVPGRYSVTLSTKWQANTSGSRVAELRVNSSTSTPAGSVISDMPASPSVNSIGAASISTNQVPMNGTSDYFDVVVYQNSGAALTVDVRVVVSYEGA